MPDLQQILSELKKLLELYAGPLRSHEKRGDYILMSLSTQHSQGGAADEKRYSALQVQEKGPGVLKHDTPRISPLGCVISDEYA
jgi:hypothetical protein